MRVLVTGAAGFVGSHVVRLLSTQGHEVIGVDRNVDSLRKVADRTPGLSTTAIDLEDAHSVQRLMAETRPEGLVHLAWYANPTDYLTSHANLASLTMTTAVLEAALGAGCRRLVAGGSCVEYAAQTRRLIESDPIDPRTVYAACKHAAWQIGRVMAAEAGADLAWARIFHIHGPGEDPRRLIPWVAAQLRAGSAVPLTDGSQVRDHLHVEDVAGALATILTSGMGGVFNVCSGEPVTLRRVLETVGKIVGDPGLLQFGALPHRDNETMFLAGDPGRLISLGWKPHFGLSDGLGHALAGGF